MILLATEFRLSGYDYRQIAREGDVALYEQTKSRFVMSTYEVVIIQKRRAETIRGRQYPARVVMPTSESWGVLGWTCMGLDRAKEKFAEAVASRSGKRAKTPDDGSCPAVDVVLVVRVSGFRQSPKMRDGVVFLGQDRVFTPF